MRFRARVRVAAASSTTAAAPPPASPPPVASRLASTVAAADCPRAPCVTAASWPTASPPHASTPEPRRGITQRSDRAAEAAGAAEACALVCQRRFLVRQKLAQPCFRVRQEHTRRPWLRAAAIVAAAAPSASALRAARMPCRRRRRVYALHAAEAVETPSTRPRRRCAVPAAGMRACARALRLAGSPNDTQTEGASGAATRSRRKPSSASARSLARSRASLRRCGSRRRWRHRSLSQAAAAATRATSTRRARAPVRHRLGVSITPAVGSSSGSWRRRARELQRLHERAGCTSTSPPPPHRCPYRQRRGNLLRCCARCPGQPPGQPDDGSVGAEFRRRAEGVHPAAAAALAFKLSTTTPPLPQLPPPPPSSSLPPCSEQPRGQPAFAPMSN